MKHFLAFLAAIFAVLFLVILNKKDLAEEGSNQTRVLRVFGYSSFVSEWGPGPLLKEIFEKKCQCEVDFVEGSDSGILLQRLKMEGESLGADLVIGLDQLDLQKAQDGQSWRRVNLQRSLFDEAVTPFLKGPFVPFDWGVLSFVARKDLVGAPEKLDDLLQEAWAGRIALQDPRTSSPGGQFLHWIFNSMGEERGGQFLSSLMRNAHSFAPSWSHSYGLFTKGQVDLVFSYVTSPLYHQLEEKKDLYRALPFKEPHPMQVEFMGIPEFCKQCSLAEDFVRLLLSPEGQKIIMEKNYMFPVIKGVREGTVFDVLESFKVDYAREAPSQEVLEGEVKKWSLIRRGEGL